MVVHMALLSVGLGRRLAEVFREVSLQAVLSVGAAARPGDQVWSVAVTGD